MYKPSRNNQNTIGDVGAAACNGRAASGKETGEVVPPARSAPGPDVTASRWRAAAGPITPLSPRYRGNARAPQYAPSAASPPAAGPPRPPDAEPASVTPPPTRYGVNCGSVLTAGAAFCAQC